MYTTELSDIDGIKYSPYVYNRTIKYQWNKILTLCIQQNYQISMAESTHRMYTTEPSATNYIKSSQYVFNRPINYK